MHVDFKEIKDKVSFEDAIEYLGKGEYVVLEDGGESYDAPATPRNPVVYRVVLL